MSATHEDWQAVVNAILIDHEERISAMEGSVVDMSDDEYAIQGELEAYKPPARRIEAYPERTDRRLGAVERRMLALETEVAHLRDDVRRLLEQAGQL